ncbi:hypothetical protein [Gemmata sp.]|uniref:hypothetical protein n=1 Tax=Gemmata sp. TaxID=1914242 RepID=UPI003F6F9E50
MSHVATGLFSFLTGATLTAVLFIRAHEQCDELFARERATNLKLAFERGHAEGQLIIVTADRNALRDQLVQERIEWWKQPAPRPAPVATDVVHERIPAPAEPFPIPMK